MKSIFTRHIQIQSLSLTILKPPPLFVPAPLNGIHLSDPLVWRVLQPVLLLKSSTFHLPLLIARQYKCQHPDCHKSDCVGHLELLAGTAMVQKSQQAPTNKGTQLPM